MVNKHVSEMNYDINIVKKLKFSFPMDELSH